MVDYVTVKQLLHCIPTCVPASISLANDSRYQPVNLSVKLYFEQSLGRKSVFSAADVGYTSALIPEKMGYCMNYQQTQNRLLCKYNVYQQHKYKVSRAHVVH